MCLSCERGLSGAGEGKRKKVLPSCAQRAPSLRGGGGGSRLARTQLDARSRHRSTMRRRRGKWGESGGGSRGRAAGCAPELCVCALQCLASSSCLWRFSAFFCGYW